jgi:beta-galactosidase beta subunit
LLPQTFAQVILFETRLAIAAFVVFLVYHTHSLMCRMLGVPENWIKLVVKKIKRWFKL